MPKRIHHVAVVLRDLESGIAFYRDKLGLHLDKVETVEEQGVKAALLSLDNTEIELLEPLSPESGVGRFLGAAAKACTTSASPRPTSMPKSRT